MVSTYFFVWYQKGDNSFRDIFRLLGWELLLHKHISAAFYDCQDSTFLTLSYHQVHFPITETSTICLYGAVVN